MTNIVKDLTGFESTDVIEGNWIVTVDIDESEVDVYVTIDGRYCNIVSECGGIELSCKAESSWAGIINLIESVTNGYSIFIREQVIEDNAFDAYQEAARATMIVPKENREMYAVLGLTTEANELADLYAKRLRGDVNDQFNKLAAKEVGDCLYMLAAYCDTQGLSLGAIAEANIRKLKDRAERGVLRGSGDLR